MDHPVYYGIFGVVAKFNDHLSRAHVVLDQGFVLFNIFGKLWHKKEGSWL